MARLSNVLFLSFCFSIPINQYLSTRLLICSLLVAFLTKIRSRIFFIRASWSILFYLIILSFGLIYSSDLFSGLRVLETSFSLVAIALIFSKKDTIDSDTVTDYFNSFCYGLSVAGLILLVNAFYKYSHRGDLHSFFYHEFLGVLNYDPTYFAYYLIFAITYLLYRMYYGRFDIIKAVLVFFYFSILLLTAGRTTFISLLLVLSFFILKYIVEDRTRLRSYVLILVFVMIGGLFLVNFSWLEKGDSLLNDSWDRMVLWESAINATPNIFFGVGTGDYKEALKHHYLLNHLNDFALENFNSHSQIIQIIFSNGLLGFIAVVLLISHPLYLALKTQNMLCVLAIFPFIIYGITEVFLGRYQGVVFFAWLHQIFIFWMLADRQSIINQTKI